MQSINNWMLRTLRQDAESLSEMPLHWLEIMRDTWTHLVMRALAFILNEGSFLICTDAPRTWFKSYVLSKINNPQKQRPFIPIYNFDSSLENLLIDGDNGALSDVLGMSYRRYGLWYIGNSDNKIAQFALSNEDSMLWTLDETFENSFTLNAKDINLDFKLIQSYRIFEMAIFGAIFGEFDVDNILDSVIS